MDPNAEDRPKSVQVAEVDIESPEKPQPERAPRTDFGRIVRYFPFVEAYRDAHKIVQENPIVPPPIQAPLASSIFRQALGTERPPPIGPALATERELRKGTHRLVHSTNTLQLSRRIRRRFDNGKRRSSSVGLGESMNRLKDASVKL